MPWDDHGTINFSGSAQIECCDKCGDFVPVDRLEEATADGLRGYAVCDMNPGCAWARHAKSLSQIDREQGGGPRTYQPLRRPPFGGDPPFEIDPFE